MAIVNSRSVNIGVCVYLFKFLSRKNFWTKLLRGGIAGSYRNSAFFVF